MKADFMTCLFQEQTARAPCSWVKVVGRQRSVIGGRSVLPSDEEQWPVDYPRWRHTVGSWQCILVWTLLLVVSHGWQQSALECDRWFITPRIIIHNRTPEHRWSEAGRDQTPNKTQPFSVWFCNQGKNRSCKKTDGRAKYHPYNSTEYNTVEVESDHNIHSSS